MLSTIMFMVDSSENTNNNKQMERWYGTSAIYNGGTNTQIVQSSGTNYPSMIADINDGTGPKKVKYIHLRADSAFNLNEIFCYELARLSNDDFTPSKSYVPDKNGPLDLSNCLYDAWSNPYPAFVLSPPREIYRVVYFAYDGQNAREGVDMYGNRINFSGNPAEASFTN